ncbi:MAG: cation:proton antiporter family protein [Myxococcota bacterium]
MFDPLMIVIALVCGLAARGLGLPSLVGFLGAGFLLHELGGTDGILLTELAELGVTLLLFSIGLKLSPAGLLAARVWATATVHMGVCLAVLAPLLVAVLTLLPGATAMDWPTAILLAFALSFSSTVFVIQLMQERGEMASRHARLAIGVLLIQDLAAVLYIGASTGKVPEWTALGLLLLIPARRLILSLLRLSGHGELFTLFGLALAILGAQVFEMVGIKGDLGALILGAILAGDPKAKELAKALLQFKDLFLVGFFVSIGLAGWPPPELIVVAITVGVLAPLKAPLYFRLMALFRAEPRIAFLSSAALSNYSEFGLIVIANAAAAGFIEAQWSATVSLSIAVSFLLSSAINVRSHSLYHRWRLRLRGFRSKALDRRRPDFSGTRAMVLGMGRIGTGAYDALRSRRGEDVVGVDEDEAKVKDHLKAGRRVIDADTTDYDFWMDVPLENIEQIMLALTNHAENTLVGKQLRDLGYEGKITAIVRFAEEGEELEQFGIESFDLFTEAGRGFAEQADSAERLTTLTAREHDAATGTERG